ncbi:hypothetical protein ACIA5D_49950 [Actinoplanes sp. NPDC051513]|uniref:hypothetical protein n=1 Tax=Actinoplanes sp. NPDC051513 TaxID=3363908 RepID=UPI0037A3998C
MAAASAAPSTSTPSTLAGNGVADLEPAAIVKKAKSALAEAKSFRFEGVVHSVDEHSVGTSFALDFKVRGADVLGALTIDGSTVELLRVGKKAYMRPYEAFWKASIGNASQAKKVMAVVKGRWVLVPPTNKDFDNMFNYADANRLIDADSAYTKGDIQMIDGKQAVAIKDTSSDPGTLFVAVEGPPYPLRMDGGIQLGGILTFTDFGSDFADLKAPSASKIVDLATLAG